MTARTLVRAAGGVVAFRPPGAASTLLAVVHRPRYDDWTFPKGKLEADEHPLGGACREVWEETGLRVIPQLRLPSTEYDLRDRDQAERKIVDYWSMLLPAPSGPGSGSDPGSSADVTPPPGLVPNAEVDGLRWADPDEAESLLTYDRDRTVLAAWRALPAVTAVVLLVRHAHAESRAGWHGPDELRPLDPVGLAQAQRLAAVLRWYAPERIVSAPKTRCTQTVTPLAEMLGLPVRDAGELSEEAFAADPTRTARFVQTLALRHRSVVAASQGGVVPQVLDRLIVDGGIAPSTNDNGPSTSWSSEHGRGLAARKGSVWALAFGHAPAGGPPPLVGAEYFAQV